MIPVLILAGGQSRRMGQDKAHTQLNGKRLIDHVISRLQKQTASLLISASSDYETGLPFIPDKSGAPEGPAAALRAALEHFDERRIAGFVSAPVDTPFLPENLVERLSRNSSIASFAQTPQHQHVTCAYWPLKHLQNCLPKIKSPSLRHLLNLCNATSVSWNDERHFLNINTPEELTQAQLIAHAMA